MYFYETQAKIINILTQERASELDVAEIMMASGVDHAIIEYSPQNEVAIKKIYEATLAHKDWGKWA